MPSKNSKKKKAGGKRDARGYGQPSNQTKQPTPSNSSAPVAPVDVTQAETATENSLGLGAAADKQEDAGMSTEGEQLSLVPSSVSSEPVRPSHAKKQFESKFRTVIDALQDDLKFTPAQVRQVVLALQYDLHSLDNALDWLCLRYSGIRMLSPERQSELATDVSKNKEGEQDDSPLPLRFHDERTARLLQYWQPKDHQNLAAETPSLTVLSFPVSKPLSGDPSFESGQAAPQPQSPLVVAPHDGSKSPVATSSHKVEVETSTPPVITEGEVSPTSYEENSRSKQESTARLENKEWILQQYQDNEQEPLTSGNHLQRLSKDIQTLGQLSAPQPSTSEVAGSAEDTGTADKVMNSVGTAPIEAKSRDGDDNMDDPIKQQLLQIQIAERELALLEADVSNEANNYMRSKQELQQLKQTIKERRKHVQGLKRRYDKMQRQEEKEVPPSHPSAKSTDETNNKTNEEWDDEKNVGNDDGDDDEPALFGDGMFDEPEDSQGNTNNPVVSDTPAPNTANTTTNGLLQCSIPSQWTGMTPQKFLEEKFRKEKWQPPKYTQLKQPRRGYQLGITYKSNNTPVTKSWQAYEADFVLDSIHSRGGNKKKTGNNPVREYLSLKALYYMDPKLQLHRLFPPDMAQIWLTWQQEVTDARSEREKAVEVAKQERVDHLLSLLDQSMNVDHDNKSTQQSSNRIRHDAKTNLQEDIAPTNTPTWEDDNDSGSPSVIKSDHLSPSSQGKQLQQAFARRQASSDYQQMLTQRMSLPMWSFRDQVLDTIRNHSVTIVCAETGAGKTTQCPQYVLEEAFSQGYGDVTKVLVTQPRRVAATSVAERVAEELCEEEKRESGAQSGQVGHWVGYQIRMEAKLHPVHTRVLFCTTGIVLRRLQDDPSLKGISHVMVDEVHERQQHTDVLLIALRQLLATTRPDLKIILMSATLDSELFCSFFEGAPLISIPGRTFPVASYHLEDLIDATDHMIEEGSRYAHRDNNYKQNQMLVSTTRGQEKRKERVDIKQAFGGIGDQDAEYVSNDYPGYKMSTRKSMDRVNEAIVNYDLIEDVLELLLCQPPERNTTLLGPEGTNLLTSADNGSILVFLPGLGEIRTLTERLEGNRKFQPGSLAPVEIIPMHSTLSSRDQRKAFVRRQHTSNGTPRKIILSTNIAETSVTIPDVVCVIDAGRVREVRRNKRTSTSILDTDWCSKASAKQRAGRAGRVRSGLCLKLFSSRTAQDVMKAANEPELKRVPLEEICLSILASGFAKRGCMEFLSQAPQPPSRESVQQAIDVLYAIGAISVQDNEKVSDTTKERNEKWIEILTPLGKHLAKLPVDVRLGKMLIFGALFRCTDRVLTIAAALSSQSIFSTFLGGNATVAKAKQRAFADTESDFLTLCNVWESYEIARSTAGSSSFRAGRRFCDSNFLNHAAMREIGDARRQYLDLLCNIGYVDRKEVSRHDKLLPNGSIYNENSDNSELFHAVLCAGLYPNVAHLEQRTTASNFTLLHKEERLYFHETSVNARKKQMKNDSWVVFHEKFGTPHRVSISTTAFVHPLALVLFGGSHVAVKHLERLVILDDWIRMQMGAQLGVILIDLRKQLDAMLEQLINNEHPTQSKQMDIYENDTIQKIVKVLLL